MLDTARLFILICCVLSIVVTIVLSVVVSSRRGGYVRYTLSMVVRQLDMATNEVRFCHVDYFVCKIYLL
jgi:hypothetical protein